MNIHLGRMCSFTPVLTALTAPCWTFLALALALTVALPVSATAETQRLFGDRGYEEHVVRGLPADSEIDAGNAEFRVANSGNHEPTAEATCEVGLLPTNPYPLKIYASPGILLRGGRFRGEVPLESDWADTYCNSAAVGIWDSPGAVLQNIRVRQVWDAVRFVEGSTPFTVREVWLSEVRDDCVENDYLNGGVITDVLFDGCFVGVSTQPPKNERRRSKGSLVWDGVLLRMQSYLYKGKVKQGVPIKTAEVAPEINIYDSVIVMDNINSVSKSQLTMGWEKISDCADNLLLWTSDEPWPSFFSKPPACFELVVGPQARSRWTRIRQNWIDCHPFVSRFSDDTKADPRACDLGEYGGRHRRG